MIFLTVGPDSTEILLSQQEVVAGGTEVRPVDGDLLHGQEIVGPRRERARVEEERVDVVFPPGETSNVWLGELERTHRAKEKKTPERRDSSWSQEGLFCMVVKVERTRVILSVTPKEEVLWVKFG